MKGCFSTSVTIECFLLDYKHPNLFSFTIECFGGMQHTGGEEDKREGEVDVRSEGKKIKNECWLQQIDCIFKNLGSAFIF